MYIPDFWAGVIATILVELGCVAVLVIATIRRDKNNEDNIN